MRFRLFDVLLRLRSYDRLYGAVECLGCHCMGMSVWGFGGIQGFDA